jgi:hypothetical protein
LCAIFATIYIVRVEHDMVDFDVYRRAAVRASHAENLYRPDDGHYQFKYLPAFAIAARPFGTLSESTARALWYTLECAMLVMLLRWSVRALPERNMSEGGLIAIAAVLGFKFFFRELLLGQTNLLLAVLLVGGLLAAQIDAWKAAGVLVGLGVFVKPYALILLPWLALAGGLEAIGAAAITVAIGLLTPAIVYGWQGNIDQVAAWFRTVTETTNAANLLNRENVSAAAAWARWTGVGPQSRWLAFATVAGTLALPAVVVSRRRHVSDPLYLEFSLLMLLIPVISPQGWDYLLLLATPAFVCIVDRWSMTETAFKLVAALAFCVLSFTMYNYIGASFYRYLMGTGVTTLATLALAVCLVRLRLRALA